jgi:NitT/TauT family transport system substrate-binding protein
MHLKGAYVLQIGWILWLALVFIGESEARRIRVAVPVASISQVAFYAAKEKGYYQEESLDVELIAMRGPVANLALIAGEVEFTGVPAAALGAALRGAPLRVLSATFERPLFSLMARSEIRHVKDLKGKKLGETGLNSASGILLSEVLEKSGGIDVRRDVTILRMGDSSARLSALMAGSIDATLLVLPWNIQARSAGLRELVALTREEIVSLLGSVVVNERLLESNVSLVEAFVRATLKGLFFVRNSRSGTIPILARYIRAPRELLAQMYDIARPAMTTDGTVDDEKRKKFLELVAETQNFKGSVSAGSYIDFSLARKINAQLNDQGWRPAPE